MMLSITIPELIRESYDNVNNEFIYETIAKSKTLQLEHSLVALSKWESKWHKPFLKNDAIDTHSAEEYLDYVRCMTITQNVDPEVYDRIPEDVMKQVLQYIEDPMSATTFSDYGNKKPNKDVITSERIYAWMFELGIPIECQKWHLNRLINTIRICSIDNTPKDKLSKNDTMKMYRDINAQRRAKLHTKG